MRHLLAILAASFASGCTSTVLAEPGIQVSPYLAVYRLRGEASVQAEGATPGDPPVQKPPQQMGDLGQGHAEEDVGVRVDLGDGFAGLRADYYRLDMGTSRTQVLSDDWGQLQQGDPVRVAAEMDELRIGWLEPVADLRTEYRDSPMRFRFAAGGVYAYRDMTLRGRNDDNTRQQIVSTGGDSAYLAARARVSWREFEFDLDYALCPDLQLSGDYDGFMHDLEARLAYRLPQRDITFFGGFRYSTLPSNGSASGLGYDADLILDGLQLGIAVTF